MQQYGEEWPQPRGPPPTRCGEPQLNPLAVLLVGLGAFVFSGYLSWTQLEEILQLLWFTHRKTHGQLFRKKVIPWLPRHVDDIRTFHSRAYPAAALGAL